MMAILLNSYDHVEGPIFLIFFGLRGSPGLGIFSAKPGQDGPQWMGMVGHPKQTWKWVSDPVACCRNELRAKERRQEWFFLLSRNLEVFTQVVSSAFGLEGGVGVCQEKSGTCNLKKGKRKVIPSFAITLPHLSCEMTQYSLVFV